jgi:hypothetical protein
MWGQPPSAVRRAKLDGFVRQTERRRQLFTVAARITLVIYVPITKVGRVKV